MRDLRSGLDPLELLEKILDFICIYQKFFVPLHRKKSFYDNGTV